MGVIPWLLPNTRLSQDIKNEILCVFYTLQAKGYAKSDGDLTQTNLEDISQLTNTFECTYGSIRVNDPIIPPTFFDESHFSALIFCTYLILNMLILIFIVLYLGKVFAWLKQSQHTKYLKDLYKASVIVLTIINLTTSISDIILQISYYHNISVTSYLIIKVVFVALICVSDLIVSCFCTYRSKYSCGSIMHALALCQFVWFMRRLTTDAIISAIAFIIAPAQTVGLITLLLSTVVCAILFVSPLLQKCTCSKCTCEINTICYSIFIAISIGLIVTVALLFIALIDNGLPSAGIGGFILSLVPPITVFVIGLFVHRENVVKFLRKMLTMLTSGGTTGSANTNEAANKNANSQDDETNEADTQMCQAGETTPLLI